MLRVYFDSNVFQILKQSHPYHKEDLLATVDAFKDKFIFCYSDAHLDDLSNSKEEYRNYDLEFMEKYVKDNYYSYNQIGEKGFQCYLATPKEGYANKDYAAAKNILSNPFDIDNLFKDLGDDPEITILKELLKSYFNLPIVAFGNNIDPSALSMDEKSKKWMDKIIPGYNPLMSVGDLMSSITPFGMGMLEDEKKVTELRKYIGEYLNRDTYCFEKWGMAFNEKFKGTGFGETFMEMIDNMLTENQKNDFYLRFSYAYSMLEIYNITQERKSGSGLKKFNYNSLNTDALHAYFASYCDYLVTDDKGLQVKANILYQIFGFSTKVLSTEDFINLKTLLTGQEETIEKFITSIKYDLNNSFQIFDKIDISTGASIRTYKTMHIYFNYFNRMQIINKQNRTTIALYCERRGHGNFLMFRESEILINKLISVFGLDEEKKGVYNFNSENGSSDGMLRRWINNDIVISLEKSEKKDLGNFLCLCIELGSI